MISGNQRASCPARGEQRAPRRCTAARVKNCNIALGDELGQVSRIGQHGHGIFARHRQRDDFSSGTGDGLRQAPAFRHNDRASPGADQRLGDFDGRLLAAPGLEARHDLQYGHLVGHGIVFGEKPCSRYG